MVVEYEDYTNGAVTEQTQKSISGCVQAIASSTYGTIPYAREMGLQRTMPKDNSPTERNRYATDLAEAVEAWEERVQVAEVTISKDQEARVVIRNGE
jgi:phage baseplate assembly protein W